MAYTWAHLLDSVLYLWAGKYSPVQLEHESVLQFRWSARQLAAQKGTVYRLWADTYSPVQWALYSAQTFWAPKWAIVSHPLVDKCSQAQWVLLMACQLAHQLARQYHLSEDTCILSQLAPALEQEWLELAHQLGRVTATL